MRDYRPASRVQFKSLGGGGGPIVVSSAIYEGRGTVQTLRELFKSLGGSMVVSSTTRA